MISGLWVGALILSSALWMADWLHKKGVKANLSVLNISMSALFYVIVLVPLFIAGTIGHPYNTVLGVDKLLVGTIIGSIVFLLGISMDKLVRRINGRQLFYYQKVVFPVSFLIIMSIILYFGLKT